MVGQDRCKGDLSPFTSRLQSTETAASVRAGDHGKPVYAYGVFKKQFDEVRLSRTLHRFVGLELGPGDSLLLAMVADAFGASAYYLVVVAAFTQADITQYQTMASFLADQGLPILDVDQLKSVETILATCRATYGTSGLTVGFRRHGRNYVTALGIA